MEPRVAAPVLWSRALVAGSFAVFLGLAGHLMADGLLPGAPWLVALGAFSVLVCVPVLARPATPLRLVALVVGGQTFIHLCLTLTAGHVGDPRTSVATPRPQGQLQLPVVDGHRVGSFQDAFAGSGSLPAQTPTLPVHHLVADLSAHGPMMAAHLVAATLVGLWLAAGERCLWTLVALTSRRLAGLVRPVLPVTVAVDSRRSYVVDRTPALPRRLWATRHVCRRGPPLLAA